VVAVEVGENDQVDRRGGRMQTRCPHGSRRAVRRSRLDCRSR
jgi:hypothetical protein